MINTAYTMHNRCTQRIDKINVVALITHYSLPFLEGYFYSNNHHSLNAEWLFFSQGYLRDTDQIGALFASG
ncbi:hypothetical protein [Pedobacter ginsenosidimutans]|uniref:hypothetical protein n=1 Tax=Pedobacter ginsenosidimutans TaxID=687842 RepID=UPI0012F8ADB1|nr:hypothetical protein [Pedobacter ginsenosidimutans]